MPDARSLTWLGVPSDDVAAGVRFFTEHLGLEPEVHEGDFAVLRLPSGQTAEMEAAGVGFIGPVHDGDPGRRWSHFRGADGYVYELTQLP